MASYDAIVLGVGGMGSAALYQLARRGLKVLGLERYDIPHDMGSSHGVTRIIRLAYYEDPSYVPLLRRAFELWRELEKETEDTLLVTTGSVDAGPAGGSVVRGSVASCETHELPHELLTSKELARRFPAYHLPEDAMANYQPDGGFLIPEKCIVAHVNAAIAAGAEVHGRERALSWEPAGEGVKVRTERGSYSAGRLVVCGGAWTGRLVPELDRLLAPERQVVGWFQPLRPELFTPSVFPVFNVAVSENERYYGFPVFGVPGFKVGRFHHLFEAVDPDTMDRQPNAADEKVLRDFTDRYFPQASGPPTMLKTCIFTNTPDEHFILDVHPDLPQVSIAAGFSGHGFKFCSVVGEIMADLATQGHTEHDLGLFEVRRFASSLAEG